MKRLRAASFADILRTGRLQSIFYVIRFRSNMRGMAELPTSPVYRYHFAQTFPFRRGRSQAGAFEWLEDDPRLGVEFDLCQVPLSGDPRKVAGHWQNLERALGVERKRSFDADGKDGGNVNDDNVRFYVCPSLGWPDFKCWPGPGKPILQTTLAEHLQEEAFAWDKERQFISDMFLLPSDMMVPRHGQLVDAETFEKMERAPSTAVGMWVFPVHAFKEPTVIRKNCFDLSATRPGLILFDV